MRSGSAIVTWIGGNSRGLMVMGGVRYTNSCVYLVSPSALRVSLIRCSRSGRIPSSGIEYLPSVDVLLSNSAAHWCSPSDRSTRVSSISGVVNSITAARGTRPLGLGISSGFRENATAPYTQGTSMLIRSAVISALIAGIPVPAMRVSSGPLSSTDSCVCLPESAARCC